MVWQRSCSTARHNMVCGERELRGERRRKGGRSLLAAAAPSFFVPLLLAGALEAQQLSVRGRVGVMASSALVQDNVAGFGNVAGAPVSRNLSVTPSPGPYVGGVLRARFWPKVAVELSGGWSSASLQVSEESGERGIGTMSVLQATLGAAYTVRPRFELGLSGGLVRHDGGDSGLLAGTHSAGLVEVRAGWILPLPGDRISAELAVQTHRFGTAGIRDAGGTDGSVGRVLLTSSIRVF